MGFAIVVSIVFLRFCMGFAMVLPWFSPSFPHPRSGTESCGSSPGSGASAPRPERYRRAAQLLQGAFERREADVERNSVTKTGGLYMDEYMINLWIIL